MPRPSKEMRAFIAVAGARARWNQASVAIVNAVDGARDFHRVNYREYSSKRDEYERQFGVFLHFLGEP